ncbi:MAG: hypothetical protein ACKO0Z_25110 [Betaproteobacteria bacterium]
MARNAIARDLRTPKYRPRVVADKRAKVAAKQARKQMKESA